MIILLNKCVRQSSSCSSNMNTVIGRLILPPISSIAYHHADLARVKLFAVAVSLEIPFAELNKFRDMVDANNLPSRSDHESHASSKLARTRANVQCSTSWLQGVLQQLQ